MSCCRFFKLVISTDTSLAQITPILLDEIEYGFHKEISAGNSKLESREVNAMKFFSGIVHRSATRVMIGSELCRDEDFLKETTNLLDSIFFTATMIVNLPLGPFRPAFVWLLTLPHKWKLARCAKKLQPVLLERIKKRRSERVGQEQLVGDAIDWTLDLIKDDPKYDTPERLAHELLHNLWAASSAPGGMMTEIVYQLLTYPEYIEPLRSEAEKAVKEGGWTEKMLANLHLQDSFIREVNRLLPTGASESPQTLDSRRMKATDKKLISATTVTCSRTVEGRPFEFSDGLKLPVGTRFGFPIQAMQHDAEHFESPLEFDAFRFVRKAQAEGSVTEDVHRWSATAMSTTNLAWGYGNHICPGRFFAIRMLKFIFTKLLLEYDVTWNREEGAARPQCINVEGQFVPNLSQKVVLGPRTQI